MAVRNDDYVPTEDLILAKPRRHYRTTVHAIHWQLRSLIGVEGQNLVYYVTGDLNKNVQRLNTTTRETETIKRLPFSPRCLVADNGWICCGGETGEFTAIHVRESTPREVGQRLSDLLPDPLPDLGDRFPSISNEEILALVRAQEHTHKDMVAESKKFGKELVNCITLWFTPTLAPPFVGAYTEPMAVLSNNDKTVALIRLRDLEADDLIPYPDCVNRAIISPDGRLLIAITDDPYLYLHERVEKQARATGPFRSAAKYEWVPRGKIHLRNQRPEDPTTVRGSFAACFSGTGKYLAVGTQSATISIFNVAALTVPGVDPLLTTFSASRPSLEYGAVRDMAFAPGYSDLLAWTEDRDRIGVADLRHGYVSRQIISLSKENDYEHLNINNKSTIDPRLLDARASDTLSSNFATSLDISPDNQNLARYYSPLTLEETLVLEALQEHRRRQEQREQREQRVRAQDGASSSAPRSVWAERNARSAQTSDSTSSSSSSRPRGERSASASRTVNDIMSDIRIQRERMRDHQERLRGPMMREESTSAADRRRGPIPPSSWRVPIPNLTTGQAGLNPSERRALRLAMASSSTDGLSAALSTLGAMRNTSDADLANYTQAASNNRDGTVGAAGESSSSPSPYEGYRPAAEADLRRRERTAYLMREWGENPSRRIERYFQRGGEPAQPHPQDTSGLAWSADGLTLIVGADDGIYEFHVNQLGRKLFPSVSLR
ncbi:hypothetical protein B0T16DRAFT_420004 [Cercophora newfieldiana]|uniref:DUF2415 domain-containing protein n=1 Tax=Cercophora newfieldiana TaxID=92897 RepID=A0AA39XWG6_9PEZI|nr:hypothetical protein B0T16DRAFT_420004 [Cercophora newfieldiana]